MTVRRLELREHETRWVEGLTDEQASGLHATGAVSVQPVGSGWQLVTTSYVGHVSVADLSVRIRPKISIRRLLFVLLYAADPHGWRAEDADLATADDLPEAVARAFIARSRATLRRGLLRDYVTRDEALPVLRGRLRAGDQLASRAGLAIPIEVTYDDFTVDIVENQLLAGASRVLSRSRGLSQAVRGSLAELDGLLEDVAAWSPARPLPDLQFHRLNAHYRPVIALAELILQGNTLDAEAGGARGTAMLFDMNRVFERFLAAALAAAQAPGAPRLSSQYVTELDVAARIAIRPDLTWWDRGRCVAVADAKYKDLDAHGLPNDDLYQLLAYCTALGLQEGHLVYGSGSTEPEVVQVRRSEVALSVHTLDLSAPPEMLLVQTHQLAQRIGVTTAAAVR